LDREQSKSRQKRMMEDKEKEGRVKLQLKKAQREVGGGRSWRSMNRAQMPFAEKIRLIKKKGGRPWGGG